jgi:nucleoid DNA-binding protein
MTKQQLIEAVANASQRSKTDVATVLESTLAEITKVLRSSDRVDLRGFGNFVVKEKKARQGRNPRTGETVLIAARRTATFRPSKELAAMLGSAAEVPSASS